MNNVVYINKEERKMFGIYKCIVSFSFGDISNTHINIYNEFEEKCLYCLKMTHGLTVIKPVSASFVMVLEKQPIRALYPIL